jgi:hypothetical protein
MGWKWGGVYYAGSKKIGNSGSRLYYVFNISQILIDFSGWRNLTCDFRTSRHTCQDVGDCLIALFQAFVAGQLVDRYLLSSQNMCELPFEMVAPFGCVEQIERKVKMARLCLAMTHGEGVQPWG